MSRGFRRRSKRKTHHAHRTLFPGLSLEQRRTLRFETLEDRRMLNGTTIITHGHAASGSPDVWINSMANAIQSRVPGSLSTAEYTLELYGDTPATISGYGLFQDSSTSVLNATSGEVILKIDWSELADAVIGSFNESTTFVGQYVADLLLGGLSTDFLTGSLQLIGHSRGASVNTALAESLAEHGTWVDQFTTLDPHPVDGIVGGDLLDWNDAPMTLWENVQFADNYWREDQFLNDFDGESVAGAYNRQLVEDVLDNDSWQGYPNEHSDVHLWYHGTIDTIGAIDDGVAEVGAGVAGNWYDTSQGMPGPRDQTGFYFSRIADGNRGAASSGLITLANRTAVGGVGEQRSNLGGVLDIIGSQSIVQGDDVTLNYRYQSTQNSTIYFGYDSDRNPFNGKTRLRGISKSLTSTGLGIDLGSAESEVLDTTTIPEGPHYLYARIVDLGFNERYVYTSVPLFVASDATPSVEIWAVGWNDPNGDGDGIPEAGEIVESQVVLENTSNSNLTNVQAWLSTGVGNVDITDDNVWYGDIAAGDYEVPSDKFDMFLDFGTTWNDLPFNLFVTYRKNGIDYSQNLAFTKTFFGDGDLSPDIVVDHIIWDDSQAGDGDGVLESGEGADMYLWLRNTGNARAEHVDVMVQDVNEFDIDQNWERYPDLDDGGPAQQPTNGDHFRIRDIPVGFSGTVNTDVIVRYGEAGNLFFTIQDVAITVAAAPYLQARWLDNNDSQLDFGVVEPGTLISRQLRLSNVGAAPLTINQIIESYPDTNITGFTPGMVIAPNGGFSDVTVEIDTAGINASIIRDLVVESNGHDGSLGYTANQTVRISGTVAEVPPVTLEELFSFNADGLLKGLAVGDTDGDGNEEIVTIGEWNDTEVRVYEKSGDNQYTLKWNYSLNINRTLSEGVIPLAVADVNGDGKDDIVVGLYSTHELFLIQSSADDSWEVTWSTVAAGVILELIVDDSDGDGQSEIIYSTTESGQGHVRVLENRGGISFVEIFNETENESGGAPYVSFGGMAVGDSDGDGRPELIFTAGSRANEWNTQDAQFFIHESTADNSFALRYAGLSDDVDNVAGFGFASVAIGDPDGDGNQEIVIGASDGNRLIIIESTGDNSWNVAPNLWEDPKTFTRSPWVVHLENIDDDPQEEIILGFSPGGSAPDLIILDGFAADSYIQTWQSSVLYNDVYSIAVSQTDSTGDPRIIVGSEVGSTVDADVVAYGLVQLIDVAITAAGFSANPIATTENSSVSLSAQVWNTQGADVDNVVVRFYDGDPNGIGVQISSDQIIPFLAAGTSAIAQVTWLPTLSANYNLHVVIDPDGAFDETDESNNETSRLFLVADNDTEGPLITNIATSDDQGDGDGIVGTDENMRISWHLDDPSGISSTELYVDGQPITPVEGLDLGNPISADVYAIVASLGLGLHSIEIRATDADNSAEITTFTFDGEVVAAETIDISFNGSPVTIDETIDVGSFPITALNAELYFNVSNNGEQTLSITNVAIQNIIGSAVLGTPPESAVPPGATFFTILPDTSTLGGFNADISVENSSGQTPFTFSIIGTVVSADFDSDGDIDGSDFLAWQRGYGVGSTLAEGDANDSGTVDGDDLTVWESQYGTSSAPLVAVAASTEQVTASSQETHTAALTSEPLSADLVDAAIVMDHALRSNTDSRPASRSLLENDQIDWLSRSTGWSQEPAWHSASEFATHSSRGQTSKVSDGRSYGDVLDDGVNEELLDELFAEGALDSIL